MDGKRKEGGCRISMTTVMTTALIVYIFVKVRDLLAGLFFAELSMWTWYKR